MNNYIIIDKIYSDGLDTVVHLGIETLYRLAQQYESIFIKETNSYLFLRFDDNEILHVQEGR